MRLLLAPERDMSILYFYFFAKSSLLLSHELMQFVRGLLSGHEHSRVGALVFAFPPFHYAACPQHVQGLYSIIKKESA